MLKPALRRAWRGGDTVQFGVTPAHAVKVGPMDIATGCFLELLDGTRGMPLLRQEARALDLSERHVDALVMRLLDAGLVDDVRAGGPEADALRDRADTLERHRPDLASLSVVHPEPGGGMRRLAARRSMRVQVRGAGRVGAAVAAVLSGAGVGRVEVLDGGCTEPGDVAPGGLPASAVGERRDMAARQLVRRAAPGPGPRAPGAAGGGQAGREPGLSLIVVAPRDGFSGYVPDPGTAEPWISSGTPHLYAGVMEATGFVGPLVLPGGTACGRLRAPEPAGPGPPVAAHAGAVAVRPARCRAGVRPGPGHGGGGSRGLARAGLPGRRAALQRRCPVGGGAAAVGLEVGADRRPPRLFLWGRRSH